MTVKLRGDSENPVTAGFLCPRGAADHLQLYRNRVFYPFVRKGGHGAPLKRASIEKALMVIADKLKSTIDTYGPGAALVLDYAGNTGLLTREFPLRLWNALGVSGTDYSLCSCSGHEAISLHYGSSYGMNPEEIPSGKLIIWWGFNGADSAPHLWNLSRKAAHAGASIVVIDPRKSSSAEKADLWLAPRPGSDVALAYGIARHLIINNTCDLEFIGNHTDGYRSFREEALKWIPGRVEAATGLGAEEIEALGRLLKEKRPALVMIGIGLQKSRQGAESARAAALLPALLGEHRGFFYSNDRKYFLDYSRLTGAQLSAVKRPLVSQVEVGRLVQQGEFKFIFVSCMNPASSLPAQALFREGLRRDDVFMAVHDSHWSATATLADALLPALHYLEKDDLVIPWSHRYVRFSKKLLQSPPECMDEVTVMQKLAGLLGRKEPWLFEDPLASLQETVAPSLEGCSWDELLAGKTALLREKEKNHYPTGTGKIEFLSPEAASLNHGPLPVQMGQGQQEGGFILITSSLPEYTHSQFQEVYGPIPAEVTINPDDALMRGINEGVTVRLGGNETGYLVVRARVSRSVPRGLLWAPKHMIDLRGNSINNLVSPDIQGIGGGPVFNSTAVPHLALE
jgi:anaerobic selenocysteine-containing dehydrogenase